MATCIVPYEDSERIKHSVEVEAESMFEAAVLAIRKFTQLGYSPGIASQLEWKCAPRSLTL